MLGYLGISGMSSVGILKYLGNPSLRYLRKALDSTEDSCCIVVVIPDSTAFLVVSSTTGVTAVDTP